MCIVPVKQYPYPNPTSPQQKGLEIPGGKVKSTLSIWRVGEGVYIFWNYSVHNARCKVYTYSEGDPLL